MQLYTSKFSIHRVIQRIKYLLAIILSHQLLLLQLLFLQLQLRHRLQLLLQHRLQSLHLRFQLHLHRFRPRHQLRLLLRLRHRLQLLLQHRLQYLHRFQLLHLHLLQILQLQIPAYQRLFLFRKHHKLVHFHTK